MLSLEVIIAPAEYGAFDRRDLSQSLCVVFDVLRATSTMLTALHNGADSVVPVADIPEALEWRRREPGVLLAGERHGLRIRADQTGGIDFDLGNSPREFTPDRVRGRRIVTTTTNGTRALKACRHARTVLVGALVNASVVAHAARRLATGEILLVCSGTGEEAAYEDVLAAGAVTARLVESGADVQLGDAAQLALQAWRAAASNPLAAMEQFARNGRRLHAIPDLAPDIGVCAAVDSVEILAAMDREGRVRRIAT